MCAGLANVHAKLILLLVMHLLHAASMRAMHTLVREGDSVAHLCYLADCNRAVRPA